MRKWALAAAAVTGVTLLLASCSSEPTDPYACVPDELGYGCNDLTGDAVVEELLPLPDSVTP